MCAYLCKFSLRSKSLSLFIIICTAWSRETQDKGVIIIWVTHWILHLRYKSQLKISLAPNSYASVINGRFLKTPLPFHPMKLFLWIFSLCLHAQVILAAYTSALISSLNIFSWQDLAQQSCFCFCLFGLLYSGSVSHWLFGSFWTWSFSVELGKYLQPWSQNASLSSSPFFSQHDLLPNSSAEVQLCAT